MNNQEKIKKMLIFNLKKQKKLFKDCHCQEVNWMKNWSSKEIKKSNHYLKIKN